MSWSSDLSNEEPDFGHGRGQSSFVRTYRCYPFSFAGKEYLESSNKILMPMSALDTLASLNISYPMIFEIKNRSAKKTSHCGVLEFTAEEGTIILPLWMMRNLLLQEGETVMLANVTLPKGSFMKLQPHTMKFLDISNPKETLEKALTYYSCLTRGDTIMITDDNNKNYYIDILETKPFYAISIVDTNCEADFAPALDYKEPEKPAALAQSSKAPAPEKANFRPFMGIPKRLDGQPSKLLNSPTSTIPRESQHACSNGIGSALASTSASQSLPKKAKLSHPSGGPGFGFNGQNAYREPKKPAASALPVSENSNLRKFMGMGIPKRLDGQPSQLSGPSKSYAPREPQHVCCTGLGLASARASTSHSSLENKKVSHRSGGSGFGPNSPDAYKEPENPEASAPSSRAPVVEKSNLRKFMGMGIPKRLDGQPSQLSLPSESYAAREPQHVRSNVARSAPTSTFQNSVQKKTISHPSEGPSMMDVDKGSHSQQPPQKGAAKFKPFTGKKYSLDSGSNA